MDIASKRLDNCNFTKVVLMIVIVFFHSILYWDGNWFIGHPVYESKTLSVIAEWISSFHVYGFTLVSGYIYRYLKSEKNRYQTFLGFIKNKTKRLLIPYIIVCCVWVIPVGLFFYHYGVEQILIKYALGTSPSQMWFLLMLFHVFVIAYIMTNFWERHPFLSFFFAMACFGVGYFGGRVIFDVYKILTALQYVLFFWIGFNLRKYENHILWKVPPWFYLVTQIILFIGVESIPTRESIIFKLLNLGGDLLLHVWSAVMIFMVLQKIADFVRWNKWLTVLNERSMTVYMLHQQIIYVTIVLFNGLVHPWLHAAINFCVSMCVSLIITGVLRKFEITKLLIGEKNTIW